MAVDTSTVQVVMPAMGDSVSEGTVLEWHKQEGDSIAADETLVEISTDKVDAEVPAPVAGTVVKIHAGEGDTVAVGALLAEIAPGGNGGASAEPAAIAAGPPRTRPSATEAEARGIRHPPRRRLTSSPRPAASPSPRARSSSGPSRLATRSRTATRSSRSRLTRSTWSCRPPPRARSPRSSLGDGETVTVGQVIGRMTAGAAAAKPQSAPDEPHGTLAEPDSAPSEPPAAAAQPDANGDATPAPADPAHASPVARRVAAANGIDLSHVTGTARGGRIMKSDVLAAGNGTAAPPAAAPPPTAGAELIKGSGAALARYMDQSRSIPTATSFRTLTVTVLDERRKQLKNAGRKVSFTHLIAYAIARVVASEMPVMAHHY